MPSFMLNYKIDERRLHYNDMFVKVAKTKGWTNTILRNGSAYDLPQGSLIGLFISIDYAVQHVQEALILTSIFPYTKWTVVKYDTILSDEDTEWE